jgi:serine/threonine-protein kinase RIO1
MWIESGIKINSKDIKNIKIFFTKKQINIKNNTTFNNLK